MKHLESIGFDEKSCNWFENDLSGRTQAVVAAGYMSDFRSVNKGVPQGSILGSLLFTIFINELGEKVTNSTIHLSQMMLLSLQQRPLLPRCCV